LFIGLIPGAVRGDTSNRTDENGMDLGEFKFPDGASLLKHRGTLFKSLTSRQALAHYLIQHTELYIAEIIREMKERRASKRRSISLGVRSVSSEYR
jgi:hypothetical protein